MPEKNFKLLMICGLFYPFVGGAERECQKLSKKLIGNGISVTVLTRQMDGLPEYEEVGGIPVYRKIKGWHLFEITYMISVLHFLLKHRKEFDIIQCFGLYLFVPPVLLMKYLFRKRVVARLECSGRFGDFWRINQLKWGWLVLACSRRFDKITFISSDIKQELIENKFPLKKLVYISNTVDVNMFKPAEEGLKYKISKNICFVGRLEEQKGVEYLIKALDIIRSKGYEVKLYIVGDGELRVPLEELCKKLKLESYIVFTGSTDNVLRYYQDAEVFVLPSISEGLPLSLLEAMSCGLPVVATCVGGNKEILDPDSVVGETIVSDYYIAENGILVNPGDVKGLAYALLKLLQDAGLSKHFRKKARTLAEVKFSLENIINEYINLYYGLL